MQANSDQEVFARLYDEFMPKVFAYIRYKVNSEEATEDITSSVFEKSLANFSKYSRDKATFSTWIFTIARNTLIDYYRTESRRQHADLDAATNVPSAGPSPEEELERSSEKECLLGCLSKLGEQEQELVRLKFGAELTNRQIARVMNLSESNVGVRLFRTVKRLRQDFEEAWGG